MGLEENCESGIIFFSQGKQRGWESFLIVQSESQANTLLRPIYFLRLTPDVSCLFGFAARGGDLVRLVCLVYRDCLVYFVRLTRETREPARQNVRKESRQGLKAILFRTD